MRTIKILPAKLKAALYADNPDQIIAAAMSVLENAGRRTPTEDCRSVTVIVCKMRGREVSNIAVMLDESGAQTIRDFVVNAESNNGDGQKRKKNGKRAEPAVPLLTRILRMGGIALSELGDLTGESRAIVRPGLFRKDGPGLDDLATRLRDDGWAVPDDPVDGGVQALRDMIQDELNGVRRHYSFMDAERVTTEQFNAYHEQYDGAS